MRASAPGWVWSSSTNCAQRTTALPLVLSTIRISRAEFAAHSFAAFPTPCTSLPKAMSSCEEAELPDHAPAFFHVVLIQFTVAEGSLWPLPGLGQLGGAVIWPTGMVMMRSGSHTAN